MQNERPHRSHARRAAAAALFVFIAGGVLWGGYAFRLWTFETTMPIRSQGDLHNAWRWGTFANEHGMLVTYDLVRYERGEDGNYVLDYVPLRLLVAWNWVRMAKAADPSLEGWSPERSVNMPLLAVHYTMELIASAGLFALVFTWCRRMGGAHARWALWWALACAAVLYLNPASLINSFGRPGTDTWVLPFFTWALWCAVTGRWWAAGVVMGIGAMMKGQVLFGLGVFVLWPVFMGRPWQAMRFAAGALLGVAVIVLPWMLTAWPLGGEQRVLTRAWAWLVPITAGCITFGVAVSRWQRDDATDHPPRAWVNVHTITAGALLLLVGLGAGLGAGLGWALGLTLAAAGCLVWARWGGPGHRAPALGLLWAQCVLACTTVFNAGSAWFDLGLRYGSQKFSHRLEMGGSMCLAGLMQLRWNIGPNDLMFTLPMPGGGLDVTAWRMLMGIFAVLYVVACFAIARQYRRNDGRFLVAVCVPWLVWFAFAAQIHERYLLFGAGLAAATLAVHRGAFVLGLFLSALSYLMTIWVMLHARGRAEYFDGFGETLRGFIRPMIPDMGWAVMLAALVFLWVALTPSRSKHQTHCDATRR